MRFLIIDDEDVSRNLMLLYIKGLGECDAVAGGREALELIKASFEENNRYDCILLDIMMPELDGHKTARLIRTLEKERGIRAEEKVKIIMVTALNTPMDAMEAIGFTQAAAYLVKPVSKENLLGILSKLGLAKK